MKRAVVLLVLLCNLLLASAQTKSTFVSGPMLGNIELKTARIWCEVTGETDRVTISYRKANSAETPKVITWKGTLGQYFNPITFEIPGLEFNTKYQYEIEARAKTQSFKKE